jgi:hypothetical protein
LFGSTTSFPEFVSPLDRRPEPWTLSSVHPRIILQTGRFVKHTPKTLISIPALPLLRLGSPACPTRPTTAHAGSLLPRTQGAPFWIRTGALSRCDRYPSSICEAVKGAGAAVRERTSPQISRQSTLGLVASWAFNADAAMVSIPAGASAPPLPGLFVESCPP